MLYRLLFVMSVLVIATVIATSCTVTRTVSVKPHTVEEDKPGQLVALYRQVLDADCDAKHVPFAFCATQHNLVAILERSMTLANVDAIATHLQTLAPSDSRTELESVLADLRKVMNP